MAAAPAPLAPASSPEDLSAAAAALWTFVHLKVPKFTSEVALDVVKKLAPQPGDDTKVLAKRLRRLLAEGGVALKHTAALDAAARLLGHASWHASNREPATPTLKLTHLIQAPDESFASWRALAPRLSEWLTAWNKSKGFASFLLRFSPGYVLVSVSQPKQGGHPGETETIPVLTIEPMDANKPWLLEAPAALETVRRHLEETGLAVLDGVAALEVCDANAEVELLPPRGGDALPPVTAIDVCNAELVLMREDDERVPQDAYEVGRGDELFCWSQFDLAHQGKTFEVLFDDGAWRVGYERYVWQVNVVRSGEGAPQAIHIMLTNEESARLLRRYHLAKRILGGKFKPLLVTKQLNWLGVPKDTYRVNLQRVFQVLDDAGYDWDSFCEAAGVTQEKTPDVQLGFVLAMAEHLKLKDPNQLFAEPPRSALTQVEDDSLLRSLTPRVDVVHFKFRGNFSPELTASVREAIEDFSASIQVRRMEMFGPPKSDENRLPHLVFAGDGEELRLKLDELGLVMYVGIAPHLFPTEGVVERLPNVSSFAFGHALHLEIDRKELP